MKSSRQEPVRAEDKPGSILAAHAADAALLNTHSHTHTHARVCTTHTFTWTCAQKIERHQTNQSANVNILRGKQRKGEKASVCVCVCVRGGASQTSQTPPQGLNQVPVTLILLLIFSLPTLKTN